MAQHKAIEIVIERVRGDVIGGAADNALEIVEAIKTMTVESKAASLDALAKEIETAVDSILHVLPSLAPPLNALHMLMKQVDDAIENTASVEELRSALRSEADHFISLTHDALEKVAQYGAEKIKDGDSIFMYSMSSTVWRILKRAKEQGKSISVAVTESRPDNEGLWTVDKMSEYGIPITVGIDAAIGIMIPQSDMVMVGADVIASTGETLCKVGTYPCALVAKAHGVPFYITADTLKLDTSTLIGLPFQITETPREKVLDEKAPAEAVVYSPHFDLTPPELITAFVTEQGFLNPAAVSAWMRDMPLSKTLQTKIPAWAHGTF